MAVKQNTVWVSDKVETIPIKLGIESDKPT